MKTIDWMLDNLDFSGSGGMGIDAYDRNIAGDPYRDPNQPGNVLGAEVSKDAALITIAVVGSMTSMDPNQEDPTSNNDSEAPTPNTSSQEQNAETESQTESEINRRGDMQQGESMHQPIVNGGIIPVRVAG